MKIQSKNLLSHYKSVQEIFIPLENPTQIDTSRLNPQKTKWLKRTKSYAERAILGMNTFAAITLLYKYNFLDMEGLDQFEIIFFGIEAIALPFILYHRKTFNGYLRLTKDTLEIKKRKKLISYPLDEIQKVFKNYDSSFEDYRIRIILNDGTVIEEQWFHENGDKKTWEIGQFFLEEIKSRLQYEANN